MSPAPVRAPAPPLDAPAGTSTRLSALRPHAGLLAMLVVATFFEGFDTKLAGFVQGPLAAELGVGPETVGRVLGFSSVGMVLAFFVLHVADRIGRRPVFLFALATYSLFTLATAFAPDLVTFTVLQAIARMAMVTELAMAYLILGETLPDALRGRAAGMLGAFAALGAAVPPALLAPLEASGATWRALFVIGALPLLLLPVVWRGLEETPAFRARTHAAPEAGSRELLARLFREHGARLRAVSLLWFAINFWSSTTMGFFTLHVMRERGWTAAEFVWLPLGTIGFGLVGYLGSGLAMDRLGRRGAATLYLVIAFLATAACYASRSDVAIYLAWFTIIGVMGIWTIAHTWTIEMFPTALRASALGVASNLLGRLGMVLGPLVAGGLAATSLGTGGAIPLLAIGNLACLPLVWWALPETRNTLLTRAGGAAIEGPDGLPSGALRTNPDGGPR